MIVGRPSILTCVAESGTPISGRLNPLDMPDDFFRIRLVCNVLDTCGVCFDRGTAKKKLDFFLTFFQVTALSGFPSIRADSLQVLYLHQGNPPNGH